MKAVLKTQKGKGFVELREVTDPDPGPREVRIAVKRAGICGTDLHIYHDEFPKVRPPVILGHEFCGVVDSLGESVRGWRKGDPVISESLAYACGQCRFCQAGDTQL